MKRALITLIDDNFHVGFKVFFKSFIYFNPWFDDDFVIIDVGLSDSIKKEMQETYSKIKFVLPNYERYKSVNMKFTHERLKKTYYTLEVFNQDYDRLIFMDMDMLVLGDLKEVFEFSGKIAGVKMYNRNADTLQDGINTGLFVINKPNIGEGIYRRLLLVAAPGHNMPDQAVINKVFKGQITYLNKMYNVEKRMINSKYKEVLRDMRVLHFVGEKPWQSHTPGTLEAIYEPMEKLWRYWRDK